MPRDRVCIQHASNEASASSAGHAATADASAWPRRLKAGRFDRGCFCLSEAARGGASTTPAGHPLEESSRDSTLAETEAKLPIEDGGEDGLNRSAGEASGRRERERDRLLYARHDLGKTTRFRRSGRETAGRTWAVEGRVSTRRTDTPGG